MFGNNSEASARLLAIHSPALDVDAYFADLETLWASEIPPTTEQERALMARHGMDPAWALAAIAQTTCRGRHRARDDGK
jgi:hypothetical protein